MSLAQTLELFGFSSSHENLKLCSSFEGVKADFADKLPVLQTMETLFIIDVDKDLSMVNEFFEEVKSLFVRLGSRPPKRNTNSSRIMEDSLPPIAVERSLAPEHDHSGSRNS